MPSRPSADADAGVAVPEGEPTGDVGADDVALDERRVGAAAVAEQDAVLIPRDDVSRPRLGAADLRSGVGGARTG